MIAVMTMIKLRTRSVAVEILHEEKTVQVLKVDLPSSMAADDTRESISRALAESDFVFPAIPEQAMKWIADELLHFVASDRAVMPLGTMEARLRKQCAVEVQDAD